MPNRDSGYPRVSGGNVAIDFVRGPFPTQTDDDRVTSPTFNATGGTTGSNAVSYQTAVVTAASATGGVVTYTASNSFIPGQTVTITGLSTSAFNLTNVLIATASATQFTVSNAATGTAVTGATATAKVVISILPGVAADDGWGTTTDISSAKIQATDYSVAVNNAGTYYTVPADNHVNAKAGWDAFPSNATGGFNSASTLTATVTGASATGGVVTFTTPNNYFSAGQTVTVTGLYNYVLAGQSQPSATQYYAPTYTTASNFNISGSIQSVTATQFTVVNAATDTALTGVRGLATVAVAASASTATVPTVTGKTVKEADRLLGIATFNTGAITYRTTGATVDNAGTVYSQSLTGTQTLGASVALVVYKLTSGENPGTQDGTFTYIG